MENNEENTGAPRGAITRVRESRFKWIALAAILLVAGVYAVGYFDWDTRLFPENTEYPGASQRDAVGFYSGSQVEGVLFFTFWGSEGQPSPLVSYRTLHTDEIYLVSYAPEVRELVLDLESWSTVNGSRVDTRSWRETVYPRGFEFTTLRLPTSREYREVQISYNDDILWRGGHRTDEAYIEAGSRTYGDISWDRAIFMGFSVVVVLVAFGCVKYLYDRVKVVPKIPEFYAVPAMVMVFLMTFGGVLYLITRYAVRQVLWLGVPIFISSFVYGIYLLRPKYDTWYFLQLNDIKGAVSGKMKEANIVRDGDDVFLAEIGWREFIKGKRRRVLVKHSENEPEWSYPLRDTETRDELYYVTDQRYDSQGYQITIADIHTQKVEEFKAELVALIDLSTALAKETGGRIRAEADSVKKGYVLAQELATNYVAEIIAAMNGWKTPEKKETEDE